MIIDNPNKRKRILFRCDASKAIGFGHVVRCIALADVLRRHHGCNVFFAMREADIGFDAVREKKFPVFTPPFAPVFDYHEWIETIIEKTNADVFILDVRDDLPRAVLSSLKAKNVLIVTIDDPSDRRLDADLAFYPPVPQVDKMNWRGFNGQLCSGWDWIILRSQFLTIKHNVSLKDDNIDATTMTLLVTMGGTDPAGLTLKAVNVIDNLPGNFDTTVVLGSGFCHFDALKEFLNQAKRSYKILQNIDDMARLMTNCHMAVSTFSVTAYELAALGVPAVYLCLTDDHAESAKSFENAGIGLVLGNFQKVDQGILSKAITNLLNDQELRLIMSQKASRLIDGHGIYRIADLITRK